MQPDVLIQGKIAAIVSPYNADRSWPEFGKIEIALCGYGSQVPRVPGEAHLVLLTEIALAQSGADDPNQGAYEFTLYSNGLIQPPGTYYTFTLRDANGDIAQVDAFELQPGQHDLTTLTPFNPDRPPAPLPTPVSNFLLIVPYSETPTFPGDTFTSWQITLNGDASATFTNLVDGNLYTIIIVQDAAGNHLFDWPDNVFNTTAINENPNGMTIQTFVAVNNELYPIGAGTYQ